MNNIPDALPEVFSEESFNNLSMLEKALYYSRQFNLGVLPIKNSMKLDNDKREPNKSPTGIISWTPYETTKPTEEEVKQWFKGGNVNIAIIAGKIYGIVVLDIDCHSPGYDGSFIQSHEIPETWKAKTGRGGYHYYFRYPIGTEVANKKMKDKGLEFMSDGSYLVGAGSKYIDGDMVYEYSWEPGLAPWDLELAEMPDWLLSLVQMPSKTTIIIPARTRNNSWQKLLEQDYDKGERNTKLASISGSAFLATDESEWDTTVIPALIKFNQTKLHPPLPDNEAHRTIQSIMSIEKRRRTEEAFTDVIDNIASTGKKKLSDKVFALMQEKTELIHDQDGNLFLVDLNDPRKRLYSMDSEDLIDFIIHTYYAEFKGTIGQDIVKNIAANLRAHAKHSGKKRTTYIRVGYDKRENALYYDLNNQAGEMVKITEDNMEIVPQGEILFRRFQNMDEQAKPRNSTTNAQSIFKYFNINSEEDKHLFLVYMIALFLPHIDMPILVLNGQAGTGKSSFFRFVKEIIDPPKQKKLTGYSFPSKQKDLEIQLTRGYFHTYDNLSEIKKDVSDIFCQVVTGGGYSTKKNYADEEMLDRTFVVRLGIGSIEKLIWYKDLIDRSLMLNLEAIQKEINSHKIMEDFIADKPEILDFIFCTLALTLGNTDEITGLPRLGDFGKWGEKISRTLGYEKNLFLHRYREKIKRQHKEINIEIIPPWVMSLVDFVLSSSDSWEDEPNKLFSIAMGTLKLKAAPDNIVAFCRTFYKYIPHLKTLGINVKPDLSGKRKVTISRKDSDSGNNPDTSDTLDGISDEINGNNTE